MTHDLYRFNGPLPDLNRIYPADLALPSDRQWLTDNPEAVARVRHFRDEARVDQRVILLTLRVYDATAPDGWRVAYVEAHPAHYSGPAFQIWLRTHPGMVVTNALVLSMLAADADTDGGNAATALALLVVPDLSALCSYWRPQFAKMGADYD